MSGKRWKVPTGAGEGSCYVVVCWCTADVALTRLIVDERGRMFLLELVRASVVRECVVARLVEQEEVWVSRSLLGSNY